MSDEKRTPTYKGRGGIIEHGKPWDRQPLRRPGEKTDKNSTDCTSQSSPVSSHSTSTLSPMAKEFVPSSRPLSSSQLYAPQYSSEPQRTGAVDPAQQLASSQSFENGSAEENIAQEHLRTIMYEITVNPGKFDMLAELLVDALNEMVHDDYTLRVIVEDIFEQAVTEANFRYNGARLSNHLTKNLNLSYPSQGFRPMLFLRCQQEFSMKDVLAKTQSERLCGFTMFMGELFIHFELISDGNPQKIGLLGQTIPQLLTTLLDTAEKENVKCVCQMLKFSGAALEDFERSLSKDQCPVMDHLFHVIKELSIDERIDRNCKALLIKVIELRASNWGRVPASSPCVLDMPANTDEALEPVFYGPDGLPLSKEEALFLESNAQYLCDNNSTEDDSEADYYGTSRSTWSMSDGMDDEMAAAFEKFVMENS